MTHDPTHTEAAREVAAAQLRTAIRIARQALARFDAKSAYGLDDYDRASLLGECSESLRILLRALPEDGAQ